MGKTTTQPAPLKVLICGAGIAGTTAAYWLARCRQPVHITVLERSKTPRPTGQAIDVREAAVDILRSMGVEDAIRACHTTEQGTALVDERGSIVALFGGSESNTSLTSEYEILRADLVRILVNACTTNQSPTGQVNFIYGEYVKSIRETAEEVEVEFANGRSPESFDLVIGADGLMSRTRRLLFGADKPENLFHWGVHMAFFSIPSSPSDKPPLWRIFSAGGGRGIHTRPHMQGTTTGCYLVLSRGGMGPRDPEIEDAMDQGTSATKQLFRERFQGAEWECRRVLDGMDVSDDFYVTPLTRVKILSNHTKRCVLIGDAGLGVAPASGCGTSLAIKSAYILAGEIGQQLDSGGTIEAALDAYDLAISPYKGEANDNPRFLFWSIHPSSSWRISVLRAAARFFSAVSGVFSAASWMFTFPQKTEKLPAYNWADNPTSA